MRYRIKARPSEAPKAPHCGACRLTKDYLRRVADRYECSRVDCPERRCITADAPVRPIYTTRSDV